jgi:hypothetical protein
MDISVNGFGPLAIDLAPDECTLYYTGWNLLSGISQFNVCTNTPESTSSDQVLFDDLRVLPNWQILTIGDGSATLRDPSGTVLRSWGPSTFTFNSLRTVSLNPDAMSFWTGGEVVSQVDLNSGQLLEEWASTVDSTTSAFSNYSPFIAVYGPPLFGNADVSPTVDSNSTGTAEAFPTFARYSGQISALHLYVDSSTTASQVVVGIYSDRYGQPGTLQDQATISNLRTGSWNYVDVPSTSVTAGRLYWIAVLQASGGGTVAFRDRRFAGLASVSARHDLSALPTRWRGGRWTLSGLLSAYGS